MPTFQATKHGYQNLWNAAKVLPAHHQAAIDIATTICSPKYRAAFEEVQAATGMPWYLVGSWLCRESGLNLNTYLGNGELLSHVTHLVPAGRGPFTGPHAFLNGAVDAITFQKLAGIKEWPVAFMLWASEAFNGMGYYGKNINDPYVWSWTQLYTKGTYTSDHGYDPNFVDPQPGVAAILKALAEINPDIAKDLSVSANDVPADPAHAEAAPARAPLSTATPAAPPAAPIPPATTAPAPQQEKQMTTPTTAVAAAPAAPAPDYIPTVINWIEAFKTFFLPGIAKVVPATYQPLVLAVPTVLEEVLQGVEDYKTLSGGHLAQSILTRVENVIGTGKSAVTQITSAPPVAGLLSAPAAAVKSEGMPNSP